MVKLHWNGGERDAELVPGSPCWCASPGAVMILMARQRADETMRKQFYPGLVLLVLEQ
jgi:hypothetical protein